MKIWYEHTFFEGDSSIVSKLNKGLWEERGK